MFKKRKYSLLLPILCFFDMADVLLGIQKARESLFSSAAYKFCLVVLYRIQKRMLKEVAWVAFQGCANTTLKSAVFCNIYHSLKVMQSE